MHACAFETFIVYAIGVNFTKMCKTWCQPVNNLCIYGQGRSHKKITKKLYFKFREWTDYWVLERRIGGSGQFILHHFVAFDLGLEELLGFRQGGGVKSLTMVKKPFNFHRVLPVLGSSKQLRS